MDLCGTGGDEKNTFNISTLASFVAAGAGAKVAKHGNYSVSSSCGSSNVLEHFGYQFTSDEDALKKQLDKTGICFLHAPLFNPAMKNVAPVRRALRLKTFFNMLGPMVNPAFVKKQMVGVFSLELARLYAYIYQQTDKQFVILHSLDGYDEISLTGGFKFISNDSEKVIEPEDLGLKTHGPEELYGGETVEEAAGIFLKILEGNGTNAQNDTVVANAAVALKCYYPEKSFHECVAMARYSLESKGALKTFKTLVQN
jgi:anthranilate phosphoribosyltransferase